MTIETAMFVFLVVISLSLLVWCCIDRWGN
jgi:hypothetical protein